jgi:hypothetical protein
MLSFSDIKQSDLARIDEIRGQATDKRSRHGLRAEGASKLTFAHEAFTMGLDQVKNAVLPSEASAMRVIEAGDNSFRFIYDVYPNSGAQMFGDEFFVTRYERTFERLPAIDDDNTRYMVRTVRVPALHLDAVWLHDTSEETNDKFIPIQNGIAPIEDRLYDRNEFFTLLRQLAEKLDAGDDESGG